MKAKVIANGSYRAQALERLAVALGETVVVVPHANAAFLKALVSHREFRAGEFDTGFIDRHLTELTKVDPQAEASAIGAAVEALLAPKVTGAAKTAWRDPWSAEDGFSLGPPRRLDLDIMVDGHPR